MLIALDAGLLGVEQYDLRFSPAILEIEGHRAAINRDVAVAADELEPDAHVQIFDPDVAVRPFGHVALQSGAKPVPVEQRCHDSSCKKKPQ